MSEELKDLHIESKNVVFGEVHFLKMKIPESWIVKPVPGRTDVEGWIEINGDKWVSSGYTFIILTNYKGSFIYPFYIKVRSFLRGLNDIWRYIEKDCKYKIKSKGVIDGKYHKIHYVYGERKWKKHILFGKYETEYVLKAYIYLTNVIKRMVTLEFTCKENPDLMINQILPLLKTVECK